MPEWKKLDWENFADTFEIIEIDPGNIVAIMPLKSEVNPCMAINAGIREVSKEHIIKDIISVGEKTYETNSHSTEVILIIEPRLIGNR